MGYDRKADKDKAGFPALMWNVPFSLPSRVWRAQPPGPGGTAIIEPLEWMVRNWQAAEKGYLGLKGLTSLLDNELGLKMMTLQSHHLRTEKKSVTTFISKWQIPFTLIFFSFKLQKLNLKCQVKKNHKIIFINLIINMSVRISTQKLLVSGKCCRNINLSQFYLHICFECSRIWQSRGHGIIE